MPTTIRRNKSGRYSVRTPGGVKAKATTKKKALRQKRLLDALDRGFTPTKRRRGR